MESSDTLVKRLVSEIQQHSKFHQQNGCFDEAVRDMDIYDDTSSAPFMKKSLKSDPSPNAQSGHLHHLNLDSTNNNINNHGESELSGYSSINSAVVASVLQASRQKPFHANGIVKNSDSRSNHTNYKQYNQMSSKSQSSPSQPPQSSTPVLSSPNSNGNGNMKATSSDVCPTCGQPKKPQDCSNAASSGDKRKAKSNGFLKNLKQPSSPPPLPPAQDPARKLQRLASFNKSDLADDLRSSPNGLSRCVSVPSLLCECAKLPYMDESKKRSTPKCSRCYPESRGRPCRYHKRDHYHPRREHHHRDLQQSVGFETPNLPWMPPEYSDCEKCKTTDSNVPAYNMDKHLSYYSALPQLWDPEIWHKRRKKEAMKSREKLLIVGVSIVSMIIFVTLTYYGVIAFQKFTELPKFDFKGRNKS